MTRKETYQQLKDKGWTLKQIANKYGVSWQCIHQMLGYISPIQLKRRKASRIRSKLKEKLLLKNLQKVLGKDVLVGNMTRLTGMEFGAREKIREIIRIRDNHTCQVCGIEWVKGERKLDIHHLDNKKEKTRQCDKLSEAKNMITLCHNCHLNLPAHRQAMTLAFRN